jgi:hypothetical protein
MSFRLTIIILVFLPPWLNAQNLDSLRTRVLVANAVEEGFNDELDSIQRCKKKTRTGSRE